MADTWSKTCTPKNDKLSDDLYEKFITVICDQPYKIY